MNLNKLHFIKYHGTGNDFILIDYQKHPHALPPLSWLKKMAPLLCDRYRGIGADGLLVLTSKSNQVTMTVINADGSTAKNCGNGLRCAAHYLFSQKRLKKVVIKLDKRLYTAEKIANDIVVSMGLCTITIKEDMYLDCIDAPVRAAIGDIGNLHLVLLAKESFNCAEAVKEIQEKYPAARDMNIGFFYKDSHHEYHLHVFERGVGFTNSCGSGASAAASFLTLCNEDFTENTVSIHQPGGTLKITTLLQSQTKNQAIFTVSQCGEATQVFTGIFCSDDTW